MKAVIRDDLPFHFSKGKGIIDLFKIFLEKPELPSHQTVCHNLDMLHSSISNLITSEISFILGLVNLSDMLMIQALKSKIGIASDRWTSKNSVYVYNGVVGFWINNDWHLVETVLDLIHLDSNHTGAGVGKLMFKSMKKCGVTKKINSSHVIWFLLLMSSHPLCCPWP